MVFTALNIINILIIFILFLFTVLLFQVGKHTRSNLYLGIYFISQILVLASILFGDKPSVLHSFLFSIEYSWGALFYLFICSLFDQNFKFRKRLLWHFVLTPIAFLLLLFYYEPKLSALFQTHFPQIYKLTIPFLITLFNLLIVGYNVAAILRYSKFRKQLKAGSRMQISVPNVWINIALWGFVVACVLVQTGNQLNKIAPNESFNWKIIGNTAFLVYFCVLFYVAVASRTLTDQFQIKEKYKNSSLNQSETQQLLVRIDKLMTTEKPFTNPELKLKDIAELLKTSERNISQAINEFKQQNVPDYINSFRVEYAMKLLADPMHHDKTILWILFEAGFNSKATFNTLFKKVNGCTPAEYRKKFINQ